jgi:hypothetical protein
MNFKQPGIPSTWIVDPKTQEQVMLPAFFCSKPPPSFNKSPNIEKRDI